MKLWNFLIFLAVLILLISLTLVPQINTLFNYQFFLVQSGSMEPSIITGDVIIVKPSHTYHQNDVVTFVDYNQRVVTHRIIEIQEKNNGLNLITKGDANRVQDNAQITPNQIIGKVVLTLPRLGYLITFGRSKLGLILLVIIPAALIIYGESRKLVSRAF